MQKQQQEYNYERSHESHGDKMANNMQHNLKKDHRVGDWMDSPLKCVLGLFKNRKTTISDSPPFHFSSAGLSMVARHPQQTTSLST